MTLKGSRGVSEEVVQAKTGKSSAEWYRILDDFNPPGKNHYQMAKYLRVERGVDPWWAQSLTVRYEYERGLR